MGTLVGAVPQGASVTSGTISATGALSAGNITINSVAVPAMSAGATAAVQTDNLVEAINKVSRQTGVVARKVTATTYKLDASQNIVIAALGGTATLANCGLTAATTTYTAVRLAAGKRKQFGKNVSGTDSDVVVHGTMEIDVKSMKNMGLMDRVGSTDTELAGPAAYTRVNA